MGEFFDPQAQAGNPDLRIVAALERLSQVFRVLLWRQAGETGLSPIQLQILLFVRFHADALCTVGHLAREFNVTRATVSDAVKSLVNKKLLLKKSGAGDARSFRLEPSAAGRRLASRLSGFASEIAEPLGAVGEKEKRVLLDTLLKTIFELHRNGIFEVQRMCYSCAHFEEQSDGDFYCRLLERKLLREDLRLDCPEHRAQAIDSGAR